VKTHLLVVRVWVLRNPTKSVAFPKPPRGDAEVSGRENRPRHSRRYVLPAHQARGVQHRRSPSYGRAKIRSYVNSAFSASPATADALAQKPPATLEETGCPRHICTANRGPKPAIRGRHGLNHGGVRIVGVRGLGCAHGGERGCDCRDSHGVVQLRQYGCAHAFFGLVDVVVLPPAAAPLVSVSSLDNSNLPKSGGSTLTINGLGFGASNFTPTSSLTTSDNCLSTAWTSVTTMTCAPRSYSARTPLISVIARRATSTWTTLFTYDGIQLSHPSPSSAFP
jgi:hypothetical protein